MIFDDQRNALYADAIRNAVDINSTVIDLGAGVGLHGLLAAKAGAKKVYLVEPAIGPDIAARVADRNSLLDTIECIEGVIEKSAIPGTADVIISVFTGNFLLEEDLLPSLFYTRDKYLAESGTLIPDRARMEVVPVTAVDYFDKMIGCWSRPSQGLDFTLLREFAANTIFYEDHQMMADAFLAEPEVILEMDFMTANEASCSEKLRVTISRDGVCHGWLGWFQIRLGDSWLSTSPREPKTHWRQAFLPLDPPLSVKAGEIMSFELKRPEFGEWAWTVEIGDVRQRHSAFLSNPVSPKTLEKKSGSFTARLNPEGALALKILGMLDGNKLTSNIAAEIAISHPDVFPNQKYARRFIIRLIEQFG